MPSDPRSCHLAAPEQRRRTAHRFHSLAEGRNVSIPARESEPAARRHPAESQSCFLYEPRLAILLNGRVHRTCKLHLSPHLEAAPRDTVKRRGTRPLAPSGFDHMLLEGRVAHKRQRSHSDHLRLKINPRTPRLCDEAQAAVLYELSRLHLLLLERPMYTDPKVKGG